MLHSDKKLNAGPSPCGVVHQYATRSLKGHCIEFGGVNRLGDSGVNRLGDTSAFVIPAGQLLLTRRGKTRIYTVGIVFEFYTVTL